MYYEYPLGFGGLFYVCVGGGGYFEIWKADINSTNNLIYILCVCVCVCVSTLISRQNTKWKGYNYQVIISCMSFILSIVSLLEHSLLCTCVRTFVCVCVCVSTRISRQNTKWKGYNYQVMISSMSRFVYQLFACWNIRYCVRACVRARVCVCVCVWLHLYLDKTLNGKDLITKSWFPPWVALSINCSPVGTSATVCVRACVRARACVCVCVCVWLHLYLDKTLNGKDLITKSWFPPWVVLSISC